ncbi:penicillin-binding protein 2 [Rhodovulum sp. 12E13]|uniref:peptidoglycan D,D-transpeptidase FtsI family protein n=1 Tax=Rhodovulum sp. 12E13 TaxID=2203891 RepID=UPI000E1709DF|nr:penicillin-binding protein 2 [Rhodovulum sp. 12E13]RDC68946.1 penicillin-binding protein 2 [Rhodovulum sp. 12E13]
MIRRPLRPLARILAARAQGGDPGAIEAENLRLRNDARRDELRLRAEGRLFVMALCFLGAFTVIGARMGTLAASEPAEPRLAASGEAIRASRADITDRNGRVLATNLATHSLYAQPEQIVDAARAARELAAIFPELDEEALHRRFTDGRKFLWIRKTLSPEEMQKVHDIGEPGLLFGPREMRLYPNGRLAAHILGGASFGREGVHSAEVIGTAGIEKEYDAYLRDPALSGAPLVTSLDLTVQAVTEQVLGGGMRLLNAKGASAILMDVHTGEILAMASLPDFDPNDRPAPLTRGEAADSPIFNRAVQGVYELGSVFKIFPVAQALELGLAGPSTVIDTSGPMRVGGFSINEFRNKNFGKISLAEILIESSNRGTGRLALQIGAERQKEFLGRFGFLEPTDVEMVEAPTGRPLFPERWQELSTVTISYGHGISTSPLHLAAGYASLVNGGTRVRPTLLRQSGPQRGERLVSEETSKAVRTMLRQVVTEGTASFAEVEGYHVGGKTGTADKPRAAGGGYYEDKVIATFASIFPAHDPEYVLVVALDEPMETSGEEPRRTAGWTAVPVAAEIIRRTAPLLGLRPSVDAPPLPALTPASNG